MARLLTICLLLSSLLWGALSCKSVKPLSHEVANASCPVIYNQRVSTATYHTKIDFYQKHFSGLLVFKALNDTTKRAVFITETGFKFFDFQFTPHTFSVQYCLDKLNKKIVINTLKTDLGFLLNRRYDKPLEVSKSDSTISLTFSNEKHGFDVYSANLSCTRLMKIEKGDRKHKTLTIQLDGMKSGNFDRINISHHPVKLNIFLQQIAQ